MAFTAKDVAQLRERTGCGMMDCKKALTEANGDMDKAIDFLREKGLAAAAKKAGSIAAEGVAYAAMESPCGFCRFCHLTAVDIFPSRCYTETVFFGNALGSGLRRMPQRDNRTDTPRTAAERPERDWDFQPQNRSGGVFCYAFA